jgi:hypothetical protein
VQPVRRPVVLREQEQPEPDLRDEQRLREREQVRDDPPGLGAPVVRPRAGGGCAEGDREDKECDGVVDGDQCGPNLATSSAVTVLSPDRSKAERRSLSLAITVAPLSKGGNTQC